MTTYICTDIWKAISQFMHSCDRLSLRLIDKNIYTYVTDIIEDMKSDIEIMTHDFDMLMDDGIIIPRLYYEMFWYIKCRGERDENMKISGDVNRYPLPAVMKPILSLIKAHETYVANKINTRTPMLTYDENVLALKADPLILSMFILLHNRISQLTIPLPEIFVPEYFTVPVYVHTFIQLCDDAMLVEQLKPYKEVLNVIDRSYLNAHECALLDNIVIGHNRYNKHLLNKRKYNWSQNSDIHHAMRIIMEDYNDRISSNETCIKLAYELTDSDEIDDTLLAEL